MFGSFAKRIWSADYPWAPKPKDREEEYARLEREWGNISEAHHYAPSKADDPPFAEGEIELTGNDIAGIGVHIAARVGARAGASEVLVSSTVKDLSAGSGITFVDRGAQELKGIPEEWRLFSIA